MFELQAAEENLRVIRTLMERATVYRAISAPAALIAGVLAVVAGLFCWRYRWEQLHFFVLWGAVLAVAGAVNLSFLYRENARRAQPFFSSGMRLALQAMLPPLAAGLAFTFWIFRASAMLTTVWVITYGLALLATSHFAPRSLINLGLTFLLAGFCVLFALPLEMHPGLVMAATFGLFHIIYALLAWPRKS